LTLLVDLFKGVTGADLFLEFRNLPLKSPLERKPLPGAANIIDVELLLVDVAEDVSDKRSIFKSGGLDNCIDKNRPFSLLAPAVSPSPRS
jgi:hypothetical protein